LLSDADNFMMQTMESTQSEEKLKVCVTLDRRLVEGVIAGMKGQDTNFSREVRTAIREMLERQRAAQL